MIGADNKRDFRDAELYRLRYQQCMTRSMTLIRLHFVATVKALSVEVGRRLADKVGEKSCIYS